MNEESITEIQLDYKKMWHRLRDEFMDMLPANQTLSPHVILAYMHFIEEVAGWEARRGEGPLQECPRCGEDLTKYFKEE